MIKKEDLLFLNRKQLLPALEQGTIDGFFQMSADPSGFLTDIFHSGKYYFLSLPEDLTDARLSELNALVDYYQAVITQAQVLGVTDERLNIYVYNTLKTNPWFKNAFGKSEQKELEMRE
jgi:hypothetical protein